MSSILSKENGNDGNAPKAVDRDPAGAEARGSDFYPRLSFGVPDFLLIIVLVMAGLIPFVFGTLRATKESDFEKVAILTVAGQEVWRCPVGNGSEPSEFTYSSQEGILIVRADKSGAWVAHSDCPDQICVRTGKISRAGQISVCIPFRAVLRIEATNPISDAWIHPDGIDAVSE